MDQNDNQTAPPLKSPVEQITELATSVKDLVQRVEAIENDPTVKDLIRDFDELRQAFDTLRNDPAIKGALEAAHEVGTEFVSLENNPAFKSLVDKVDGMAGKLKHWL